MVIIIFVIIMAIYIVQDCWMMQMCCDTEQGYKETVKRTFTLMTSW